ncbi:MAG TPA: LytTR family DNA-binding domain-containing protein [Longimicrobium sp.]|jgi:two-component system LytT family response regulator|uniref:LytR/AlgR family response regulator transcription factor n=1 Tax=Longimicrobium sp. TaxID=2029185 RepID=UPI002ED7DC5B
MTDVIRTLVVDDDPLSRARIRGFLEREDDVEVVGECADGAEAIPRIRAERPDLVFLDVQMPGVDGFGVVEAIGAERMPVTVFASAYVEFALRAFEACALDYLLKPFDEERFGRTLGRARAAARSRQPAGDPRLDALVQLLRAPARPEYPQLLAVKSGDQYRFVEVGDIDWIEADGNYIRLHVGTQERLVHKTLQEMEEHLLDPARFVRIHRSTIVNLSRIATVEPLFHRELSVALKDGTRLVCSRRYRPRLQERVYFTG